MTVETVVNLDDLNPALPGPADPKSEGDDHIRNLKKALLEAFAGFTGAVLITGTDGGAANVYTLAPSDPIEAYGLRMHVAFSPAASNTGACTLNVSSLGAKPLRAVDGTELVAGDLVAGLVYGAIYTGTEFRLAGPTKNYVDQLAFSTALPNQTGNAGKFLRTNGAGASWEYPGINALHPLVTDNITLAASHQYVPVQMAALGRSITLPGATTLPLGGPQIIIDNSEGRHPVGIRSSGGVLVGALAAGGSAVLSLRDNSTAAGEWVVTGNGIEPGFITLDTALSSTYLGDVLGPFVALDDNTSIHFAALSAGFAAFVVDNAGKAVSTPVTIDTNTAWVPKAAFKISATQAILFYGSTGSVTTQKAVVLTISGTSPTLSLSVGTPVSFVTATGSPAWGGEDSIGAPKIAQLTATLYIASLTEGTNTAVIAASVSGSTITLGAQANIVTAGTVATSTATYSLSSSTALVFYLTGAGPYTVNSVVVSVSGVTCTIGAPVASGSKNNALPPVTAILSSTKALLALGNNSGVFVKIVSISGASITLGTEDSVEAVLSALGYTDNAATRYNAHLSALSSSSALLWYVDGNGVSRALVLTESAGAITKGPILYRSFSIAASGTSGFGAILPIGSSDFLSIVQNGIADAWRNIAVSHRINGNSISYGGGAVLTSLSGKPSASAFPATRLASGDYVVVGANSSGLPVLRTNGDSIDQRGVIALPNLTSPTTYPLAAVSARRLVLLGGTSGTTVSATGAQLRILNIEVAA